MNQNENANKQVNSNLETEELSEKHWQILDAAVRVFSEKGFSASRTSEIAKEAGVSEGTIFNYFKTKKDLLIGLLLPLVAKFFRPIVLRSVEKIFKNPGNLPIEEVLQALAKDRLELAQKNLPLLKTVAAEALFHPELLAPLKQKMMPQVVETGTTFINEQIEKGTFRDVDPTSAFRILMSIMVGYLVLRNTYPEAFDKETEEIEIRRLVDIYLNGVKAQE